MKEEKKVEEPILVFDKDNCIEQQMINMIDLKIKPILSKFSISNNL